ncbi:MAG: SDR family oxidoreductase [Actinomycetes bacterium]
MSPDPGRRTVLVTGGTRGIGREVVRSLAAEWHVLVGGRDAAAVASVVAECPNALGFVADLSDEAATAAATGSVSRLDAVVHSAGVVSYGGIDTQSRAEWRRVLELNVVAVADLTRLVLPLLRQARGHVIVINSGAGLRAGAATGVYAASKFAVRAWADAVRDEERGVIRVTSVHPGRVDTDMQAELQAAEGRAHYDSSGLLTPESVARAVVFALDAGADASVDTITVRPAGG